jgi:hypothetical protein
MAIVDHWDGCPSRALRAALIVAGLALLALWGASAIPVISNWNNPSDDGFSAVPVFYATLTVLPIGIVVLAGALNGTPRGMRTARGGLIAAGIVLGLLALFFAFMLFATLMNWG